MVEPRRVVLFGGQGSSGLISEGVAKSSREATKASTTAAILLSRCHAAFLEELADLSSVADVPVGLDSSHFRRPDDLLLPSKQYHKHGIIQSSTICLYQLLHYLAEITREDRSVESTFDTLSEAAGLCSGMIPAVVVASSQTEEQFLSFGVAAFRLAFWLGWRVAVESRNVATAEDADRPWSLVISGLPKADVEACLETFNNKASKPLARISVISGPTTFSISGPPSDLVVLKEQLNAPAATFAHVYSWYHGGDHLENAVSLVYEDIQRRSIDIPSAQDLRKPVRSTLDGSLFDASTATDSEFEPWLLRHLLVHCVDWSSTAQGICKSITESLEQQPDMPIRIMSVGPSTLSLVSEIKSTMANPDLDLVDISPFKPQNTETIDESSAGDIAVVGMGINLPGGASLDELWDTLSKGMSTVQEIPESRFKLSDYYNEGDTSKARSISTKYGSFIDDIWNFDNSYFNISPREAKSMDPQQRVLLHTTQSALDDAGYVRDSTPTFQRDSMACYIGLATGDYTDNLRDSIDVFYSPGTLRAFHSGRISYVYKLSGPSIVTDTACSSSAVSIHQACQALRNGDCTSAIAGGVNTISSPDMYLGLSHGHFLSPTGGCKPFDAAADGYCRAEGCVIFVLKLLSDALLENDRIHGVIKGTAINQSGNSHSITHPHSETQRSLYKDLFRKTSIKPSSISVVEAHGTGTQAGDTRETASLDLFFGEHHSPNNPLIVSSIKGNIGHCEAASGAASLAKLLLMMKKKELVPQGGLKNLNTQLTALMEGRLLVPQKGMKWKHAHNAPRRAMLNNFGAAGSNAAFILEEFCLPDSANKATKGRSAYPFNLSAKSKDALQRSIANYEQFLDSGKDQLSLEDVSYTATARRDMHDFRISLACNSVEDLRSQLSKVDASKVSAVAPKKNLVFVFSGQGCISVGMGKELLSHPEFKATMTQCDQIVRGFGFGSVLEFIQADPSDYRLPSDSPEYLITSQCACVAVEYSLARFLMSCGLKPDCMIGHSLGEYAALAISNAISLEDALRVVALRAELMTERCPLGKTGMLAARLSAYKADAIISEHDGLDDLSVACHNSDEDCVISGPLEQLESFEKICTSLKTKRKLLKVPYGYHSAAMEPIAEPLRELGSTITWSTPEIPIASNVYGRFLEDGDLTSNYFALHAIQPVRFCDAIGELRSHGIFADALCLEVGPHPITLPMIRQASSSTECACVPTLQNDKPAWTALSNTFVQLFTLGSSVNWRNVFAGTSGKMTDLPGYPLKGSSFEVPFAENSIAPAAVTQQPSVPFRGTGYELLPMLLESKDPAGTYRFETSMLALDELIAGHNVGGTAICPASVYMELAMEGTQNLLSLGNDKVLTLEDMTFASPLIRDPAAHSRPVYVIIDPDTVEDGVRFKVTTRNTPESDESICCTGTLSIRSSQAIKPTWLKDAAIVRRQKSYLSNSENNDLSKFQTKVLYESVFTRVVHYSSEYQTLEYLSISEASMEGIGRFRLPKATKISGRVCPPCFTDTLFHAAGFIANLIAKSTEICICSRMESVEVLYHDIDYSQPFTIYCSLFEITKGTIVADVWVANTEGEIVAVSRGTQFKKLQLASFQKMIGHASPVGPPVVAQQPLLDTRNPFLESRPKVAAAESNDTHRNLVANEYKQLHKVLCQVVSQVSGFKEDDLSFDSDLESMGIDSLMEIELATKLKEQYPNAIKDHNAISGCTTLMDIEQTLMDLLGITNADTQSLTGSSKNGDGSSTANLSQRSSISSMSDMLPGNPVTVHSSDNDKTPLFLVHDGSGLAQMYMKLCQFDRDTYAFHDPHFVDSAPAFTSLVEMASQYAVKLTSLGLPSVILGGWSFGGVVAYEMAQQLHKMGVRVEGLILIDSPYPVDHKPLPTGVIAHITRSKVSDSALAQEFQRNASLLGSYTPAILNEKTQFKIVMLQSRDTFDTEASCGIRYDWLSSQDNRREAIAKWEGMVGRRVDVLPIDGNHFEPFTKNNIESTSTQLWKACRLFN